MKNGKVVSIEIGMAVTRICEVDYKKKNPRVYRCGTFPTPDKCVEEGYIRDKEKMAKVLKEKLKALGIKNKNVVFSITSNKILSREVTIPLVADNKIYDVVVSQANDYFPMDISNYIIAYNILKKSPEDKKQTVIVFAAPSNMIKTYFSFAQLVGLNIVSIDYSGNAAYQWLKKISGDEIGFYMVVNEQSTMISILNNGVLALQRTVNYGVNVMTEALVENKNVDFIDMESALKQLQETRCLKSTFNEQSEDSIKEDVTDSLKLFVSSVTRIIEYFTSNFKLPLSKIHVVGIGSTIKGLDTLLTNELSMQVYNFVNIPGITFPKENIEKYIPGDMVLCAAAGISPLGFIPTDQIANKKGVDKTLMYVALFFVVMLVSVLLTVVPMINYNTASDKNEKLAQKVDDLGYIEAICAEYLSYQNAYTQLEDMHKNTYTFNEEMNTLIAELEDKIPSETLIHSLSSTNEGFTINVTVNSKEAAAKLISQLELISFVDSVTTNGFTDTKTDDSITNEVTFAVNCTYKSVEAETEESENEESETGSEGGSN